MGARERAKFRKQKTRRRRARALLLLVAAALALVAARQGLSALERAADPEASRVAATSRDPSASPLGATDPPNLTIAGHAYEAVAGELPGVRPRDVSGVRQSVLDPTWSSARIRPPGLEDGHYYAVFPVSYTHQTLPTKRIV